jgi:hypothetical protein
VLRDGAMRVGTAAAFFAVGTVIALTIVLPLYAQLALGLSVSESGWAIIALQGAATITSIVGGRLLVRFTHYKRCPRRPSAVDRGAVPLALAPTGFSPAAALGLIALVGLGLGATFPFTIVVVQNGGAASARRRHRHDELLSFARFDLHRRRLRCDRARGHAGEPRMSAGAVLAGTDAAEAFRWVFAAAILCLAIALACILALEERPLRGSSHREAAVE